MRKLLSILLLSVVSVWAQNTCSYLSNGWLGCSILPTSCTSGVSSSVYLYSNQSVYDCLANIYILRAGGSGSVTSFSAGALSPLFTTSVANPTTTPALTFNATSAAQNSIFGGPATGGAGLPSFQTSPTFNASNLTNLPLLLTTTGSSGAATYTQSTNTLNIPQYSGGGGGGTVTSFTSGNLVPLFTTSVATSTSTPSQTFALSNFGADNIFGNFTGGSATPSTQAIPACANDGGHALVYVSHVLTCETITGGGGGIGFNGTPTANAIVTDFDATHIQTPSATSTLDSSGNQVLAGTSTATQFIGGPTFLASGGESSTPSAPSNDTQFYSSVNHIVQFTKGGDTTIDATMVVPTTSVSHEFVTNIPNTGVQALAQPAFSDISGTLSTPSQLPNTVNVNNAINVGTNGGVSGTLNLAGSSGIGGIVGLTTNSAGSEFLMSNAVHVPGVELDSSGNPPASGTIVFPTTSAPSTPSSGFGVEWFDTTRLTAGLTNSAGNVHIMPRTSGSTDQLSASDLSNGVSGSGAVCLVSGSVCSGAGASLVIGVSTITGGANTNIEFNNSGVLGEYTVSGTGSAVAMNTSPALTTPKVNDIRDANNNVFVKTTATASAVDSVTVTNAATANPATVVISATGTDSNINLNLVSKGTGTVECNGSPCGGGGGSPGGSTNAVQFNAGGSTFGGITLPTSTDPQILNQIGSAAPSLQRALGSNGATLMSNPSIIPLVSVTNTGGTDFILQNDDTSTTYSPATNRSALLGGIAAFNAGGGTCLVFDNNGTSDVYLISTIGTVTSGANQTLNYVLVAGHHINVNCTTTNTYVVAEGIEGDAISDVYTAVLPGGGGTGTQTIYTVPASSHAMPISRGNGTFITGSFVCTNNTGGAVTVSIFNNTNEILTSSITNAATTQLVVAFVGKGGTAIGVRYSASGTATTLGCYTTFITDTGSH